MKGEIKTRKTLLLFSIFLFLAGTMCIPITAMAAQVSLTFNGVQLHVINEYIITSDSPQIVSPGEFASYFQAGQTVTVSITYDTDPTTNPNTSTDPNTGTYKIGSLSVNIPEMGLSASRSSNSMQISTFLTLTNDQFFASGNGVDIFSSSVSLQKPQDFNALFFGNTSMLADISLPTSPLHWNSGNVSFFFTATDQTNRQVLLSFSPQFNPVGEWLYHNFTGNEGCSIWSETTTPGTYNLKSWTNPPALGVADGDYQIVPCSSIMGQSYNSYSCLNKTRTDATFYPYWTWVIIDNDNLQYVHTYNTTYDYTGTYMAWGCQGGASCPAGYISQNSYSGDCLNRPPGSVCVQYNDNYIWLVNDSIAGWNPDTSSGTQTAYGTCTAGYEHILNSKCVQQVGTPVSLWYEDADNDGVTSGKTLTACDRPAGYKLASELSLPTTTIDNCPQTPNGPRLGTCLNSVVITCHSSEECGGGVCSMNQEDSNGDGLGDACSGIPGGPSQYTLTVPPNPQPVSQIMLTATFVNNTGQDIVTPRPDCIGNTTFTLKDSAGNRVDPIDRIRAPYRILPLNDPNTDLITILNGTRYQVSCPMVDLYPPAADILFNGQYTVQGTFSNYIQAPPDLGLPTLWMGAIKSKEQTITVYRNYAFNGFLYPLANGTVNKAYAGLPIPVIWNLTDPTTGKWISDPSSFKNLYSYKISCMDLTTPLSNEVQEYAAGSSGLKYYGWGIWQFIWKTPTSYAGQCRMMELKLNDGSTQTAEFKFK